MSSSAMFFPNALALLSALMIFHFLLAAKVLLTIQKCILLVLTLSRGGCLVHMDSLPPVIPDCRAIVAAIPCS